MIYNPAAEHPYITVASGGENTHPAFSPSGDRLMFVSDRSGNREIYLADVGLTGTSALTALTDDAAEDSDPAWSPDESRVVFRSRRDGNNEIYIMSLDGLAVTRLTNDPADDITPAWSPDGTRIAFSSARADLGDYNLEIYVMSVDGSDAWRVTYNPGVDAFPAWSPDGSRLAFHSERGGNTDIYDVGVECIDQFGDCESALRRLTWATADDMAPVWDGDGDRIIFMSAKTGTFHVYEMDPMSSVVEPLPGYTGYFSGFPSWGVLPPDPVP